MQANSSSLGISRRAPSISVTWEPSVWNACAISTPTTPPPSTTSRSGISLAIVASRFVHAPSIASSPGIGGIAGSEPVARKTARLASISSSPTVDPALAGEPAVAADQLDLAVLEPRQLRVVVEVVDDLVAPCERGRDVELAGHGLGGARDPLDLRERLVRSQQRLRRHARPERALAADEAVLDDRDLQSVLGEPPRRHLTRRPGADDHHIEAPHGRPP